MDTNSPDLLSDPEFANLSLGPTHWDRRRRNPSTDWATACLEHAANHLIEDQMRPDRSFWPGARDAVSLLRAAMEAVGAETMLHQHASRVAASWVPKSTLARQAREDASEA